MRSILVSFLLSFPLILVRAVPLNYTELFSRTVVLVPAKPAKEPVHPIHECTCNGRHYSDVYGTAFNPELFHNYEGIELGDCPKPMMRWILSKRYGDRAIYSGNNFCACVTHQGFNTPKSPNAYGLC